MSIYSGFPTRKDQTKYNDLLSKLILMMQQHIVETVQGAIPQKKVLGYTKVITKMKEYQEHKYLPPKFTELLDPLCKLIGFADNAQRIEEQTSMQMEQKLKFMSQKTKSFAQSVKKQRIKSKLISCLQNFESKNLKKGALMEEQKESQLKSTSHLKQRKFNFNLQSGEGNVVQVGNTYEQEQFSRSNTAKHIMGSQPIIVSNKIKNNLRYRAYQGLIDAQQNIHKRNTPLKQQIRKKLKTTEQHSTDLL